MTNDYDVLIVGAGGGGLAAALAAVSAGASVMVVDSADKIGGAMALSGGSFMAAATPVQVEAGYPDDTADEFFDYWITFNRHGADPAVVRKFVDTAAPTLQWLIDLGVQFTLEGLYRAGLERSPRSHRPVGGGLAIVNALSKACRGKGIDIAVGNRVESLIVEDGRVVGVTARGEDVRAGAVIIATGGFGNNPELLEKYYPDSVLGGEKVWSPAPSTCQGDGLIMGQEAGAASEGINHGELLLSTGFGQELEPFPPSWLVLVDPTGRRFVSELAPHTVIEPLVVANGGYCWVILDEDALQTAKPQADQRFGAGSWVTDTLLAEVARGVVYKAETLAGLAAQTGMSPEALTATCKRYSADCAAGADTQFLKDPTGMKPIATAPFYAVKMMPMVVGVTGYGLKIDADARVLREIDNEPIPGLYACGEVTGNIIGPQYVGGGNAVGGAIIFGKIAGETAVADQHASL